MIRLIMNENRKLYQRRPNQVLVLLTVIIAVLSSVAVRMYIGLPETYNIWDKISSLAGMMCFVDVFTIVVASGMVANEFQWGTIKLLLIRPINRGTILMAKYLSVILFSIILTVLLVGTCLLVDTALYGLDRLYSPAGTTAIQVVQLYSLRLVETLVFATIAFMLSVITRSNAGAVSISLLLMFIGPQFAYWFSDYPWVRYLLFANTDLTVYLHAESDAMRGMSLSFSAIVLALYCLFFNAVSWTVFAKTDVM